MSVAAAAAAAAVASARRPKFHVLVASMDAAAQDLLLLRQVAWETMIVVEDSCGQRSVTMSALPRLGSVQSANRVLMLDGLLPNTTSELLSILDFIKQSPEGMMALERHLLGLEDVNAFAEASGILEQVCLDLSILKPPRAQRHLERGRSGTVLENLRENLMRAKTEMPRASPGAGAGSGIVADAGAGQHVGGKRSRDASVSEPTAGGSPLRRPKASRAGPGPFSQCRIDAAREPFVRAAHAWLFPASYPTPFSARRNRHSRRNSLVSAETLRFRTRQTSSANAAAAAFAAAAAAARGSPALGVPAPQHPQHPQHPMLALAATMQSDPLAAAAMMQNMQQMMVPMASAPGSTSTSSRRRRAGFTCCSR